MTKLAYVIGCPALGLHEAVEDAAVSVDRLERLGWTVVGCNTAPLVDFQAWLEVPRKLHGADIGMIYDSGHGYTRRIDGKVETGLWTGMPIPHAWLTANVVAPARQGTRYLVRVYDACYAAGAIKAERLGVDASEYRPRVKGLTLSLANDEPADVQHYKPIDAGDVVFSACGARQFSYGYFDGGLTETWHALNTVGRSLFTQCFWSAAMCCDYGPGRSLNEIAVTTQWRVRNCLEAFAKKAGWLMAPGVKYPIPTVTLRKGKGVPDNILIA